MLLEFAVCVSLFVGNLITNGTEDTRFNKLYPILNEYVRDFPKGIQKNYQKEHRFRLNEIVITWKSKELNNAPWQITFISTNESTIGQMAQAWSKAAAYYFGFKEFHPYSGGL
jgi:hypothetical protein